MLKQQDIAPAFAEQRADPREQLVLPLKLGEARLGMTRDISATGLYFEVHGDYVVQGTLDFELQLPEPRMKFTAIGQVVRIEHSDGKTGIAVRLLNPRLDYLEDPC